MAQVCSGSNHHHHDDVAYSKVFTVAGLADSSMSSYPS